MGGEQLPLNALNMLAIDDFNGFVPKWTGQSCNLKLLHKEPIHLA
jgi:hypothetical protein